MDVLTHAIIGAIIAELALWEKSLPQRKQGRWIGAFLGAAPDLGAVPAHIVFSWVAGDWPWVYNPEHWIGVENSMWLVGYWFTHSLLFPLIAYIWLRYKGMRSWMLFAWSSHAAIDILSHTGAWSTWPFFPLPGQIEGVADPWSWSPIWWIVSITIALTLWYSVSVMTMQWRINNDCTDEE